MAKIKTMVHSFGYSIEQIYSEYFLLKPMLDAK
jgi:hypothetical protein